MDYTRTMNVVVIIVTMLFTMTSAQESVCDSNPCQNGGTCFVDNNGFMCNCTGGFEGTSCRISSSKHTDAFTKKSYWYVTGKGTWEDFLKVCHIYGGTLMANPKDDKLLLEWIASYNLTGFIGLSSGLAEAIWRWSDTSTTALSSNFEDKQPNDTAKIYAYVDGVITRKRWVQVGPNEQREGGICMDRDPKITCWKSEADKVRGCLLSEDTFVKATGQAATEKMTLSATTEEECSAMCLYSIAFKCEWYFFDESSCSLGDEKPKMDGDRLVYVRQVKDTTKGRCVSIYSPASPGTFWLKESSDCTLVVVNDEVMYDIVVKTVQDFVSGRKDPFFIGLHSTRISSWKFNSKSSPIFTQWKHGDDYTYATGCSTGGGDELCACATVDTYGDYISLDCNTIGNAVCERPAAEQYCRNPKDVPGTTHEPYFANNIRMVRYTCKEDHFVFSDKNMYKTYDVYCPCEDVTDWSEKLDVPSCEDYDNCRNVVCQNGGTCTDFSDAYECTCALGYTGEHCDENINECHSTPCEHGGQCVDGLNKYECVCSAGFEGTHCETDKNECESNPCAGDAHCKDEINKFECHCHDGFQGVTCNVNIDECASKPCKNDGTCFDGDSEYHCTCPTGYEGYSCDQEIDNCNPAPCWNGGSCQNTNNGFTCICPAGFNGANCNNNIDECENSPCKNGGTCFDQANHYTCVCKSGYDGDDCDDNVDECDSSPCKNGGKCVDNVNRFDCECAKGFMGDKCDIDVSTLLEAAKQMSAEEGDGGLGGGGSSGGGGGGDGTASGGDGIDNGPGGDGGGTASGSQMKDTGGSTQKQGALTPKYNGFPPITLIAVLSLIALIIFIAFVAYSYKRKKDTKVDNYSDTKN